MPKLPSHPRDRSAPGWCLPKSQTRLPFFAARPPFRPSISRCPPFCGGPRSALAGCPVRRRGGRGGAGAGPGRAAHGPRAGGATLAAPRMLRPAVPGMRARQEGATRPPAAPPTLLSVPLPRGLLPRLLAAGGRPTEARKCALSPCGARGCGGTGITRQRMAGTGRTAERTCACALAAARAGTIMHPPPPRWAPPGASGARP